jgi:hypothetical protein
MDMTSTAEASRWYGNQRLPGSPNTSLAHQNASSSGGSGGVDASEMSAYYALENSNAHRRYYSAAAAGYSPHSKSIYSHLSKSLTGCIIIRRQKGSQTSQ